MKKLLLILCSIIFSVCSYAQTQQSDIWNEAKQLLETVDTTGNQPSLYQQSMSFVPPHGYAQSIQNIEPASESNQNSKTSYPLIAVAVILALLACFLIIKKESHKDSSKD